MMANAWPWPCRKAFGTNTIFVVEDEVTYGMGGRWGEWSGGGGSSLELIDPHSNHRLAANWADSDDTAKIVLDEYRNGPACLDNGANSIPPSTTPKSAYLMQANVWSTTSRSTTMGTIMFPTALLKAAWV